MSSPNIKSNEIKDNEEEIIINLINDIFQYENKIQEVNNFLYLNNTTITQNEIKLSELKHQKSILAQKLENIQKNISELIKNKDIQIKLKESMKNEIQNKIEEYKFKLNTLNSLSFNSLIKEKIFPNNNLQNEILTNKQINDILMNTKSIKNIPDEENKYIVEDIINKNKSKEKVLIDNINNLKLKINQIDEILKMIKEEKYSTNNELINIISCKESIDALIKFNHYLIKNYTKDNSDKDNLGKDDNNIDDEINNDEELYKKNKWTTPVVLFFYEICAIDSEKFSIGFNDIIIDIYDICSLSYNNLELSSLPSKKRIKNQNIKKDNSNSGTFSIAKILKKEFEFFVKINKNNALINSDGINKNFLEKISSIIINKLKLFIGKKYNNEKFNEISKNVIIYLSYYVKSLYYEKIINGNLKFINKEYKYNKKELQNICNNLIVEIKKLELKQKDLHQQIDTNEKEIKSIQDKSLKNNLINNLKNENLSNLSKNEQEYIQLCSKINNLLLQKDEVNSNCEKINSEYKEKKEEMDIEENKIKKEISDINKEIEILEEDLEQKKIKSNKEIIEYRKIIAENYNKIKSQLKICKKKYGENTEQYDYLIQNINEKIKTKEKMSLKDLDMNKFSKKVNNNKNEINSNHVINSYEDNGNSINKNKEKNKSNNFKKNYYNLEFSTNRFNKSNKNKSPINIKLKANKEKIINLFSSNKLQKHNNYIEKYFITNSNKDSNNEDKNYHLNLKSSAQLKNYPGFKSINNYVSNTDSKNNSKTNQRFYNTALSYHDNSTRITSLLDKYSKNIPYYDISQNKNQISYFNSNRTIHPYQKEKFSSNIDLKKYFNKTNDINNNETNSNELSKTINELKNNIIKNEKLSNNLLEKIKILTKITFCFFRRTNKNNSKFNPLNKISNESLSNSPYNFIKSSISLNKSYNSIRIGLTAKLDPIDIYIKDIEYTIVSSSMKNMIEMYRSYKKYIKNGIGKCDKDSFIKNEMNKNKNLNYEYINKCIENKKYYFTLFVEENQQMEFIFFSYDDFKTWINGLAFIIKNKNKLLEFFGEKF